MAAEEKAGRSRPRRRLIALGLLAAAGGVATIALLSGTGSETLPYDFNGDGIADLAIGVPGDAVGGDVGAGSVIVADGTSTGPEMSSIRIDQDLPEVPGGAETGDSFGQVLASGDFDNDGFADLAVSSPIEAIETTQGAGSVTVHYGSATGLHDAETDAFNEDTAGMPGAVGWDELFAYSLAAGDLNGDGYADLVIGQPLDHVSGNANAGSLRLVFGSANGLTAASAVWIDQSTPHVPGVPEPQDRFGEQLTVGDINADGTDDLVVATIGEQVSGSSDRGSIHVLYGPMQDSPASGEYLDSAQVNGIGEFSGSALTLGHFNDDPYLDVAVGVSDQKVAEDGAAGRLAVFYADADGLSPRSVEQFDQDTPGITGSPEDEDYFASSLAAGDFDGDGVDDLIVGMRSETVASQPGSGAAMVLFGNASGGIATTGALWIDQETAGVPGTAAQDDHFGWTVGALDTDNNGRAEPLIGAPGNAAGTVTVLKITPGTLESAMALAESDLGWATGTNGDAFGIALPNA